MKLRLLLFTAILLFYACGAFSQAGMWTWLKGTGIRGAANFGTQGVEASTNTPGALYEACEWTDTAGNFWLFGSTCDTGLGAEVEWGDLWKFNPLTDNWTWIKGAGIPDAPGVNGTMGVPSVNNTPAARAWGVSTWVDANGDLWLYGGYSHSLVTTLNDMWRYNIATNSWTWMEGRQGLFVPPRYGTMGVESATNTPGGRQECDATWTDKQGNLWVYGGLNIVGHYGDLWKYDVSTNYWTWMGGSTLTDQPPVYGTKGIPAESNIPGGRDAYCTWTDAKGNFWMYGGVGYNYGFLNDMWRYEPATGNWTWMSGTDMDSSNGSFGTKCISDTGMESSGRFENRARWKDDCGNFWFYAGLAGGANDSSYNDLWYFNPVSLKWTFVNGGPHANAFPVYGTRGVAAPANTPGCRGGALPWRSKAGALYLFGGLSAEYNYIYNDLWMYTVDTSCGDLHAGYFAVQVDSGFTICGQNTGSILVTTDSGNAPYTYQWNTASTSDSLENLSNGTYLVTVTDHSGCSVSASAVVDSASGGSVNITTGDTAICTGDSTTLCAPSGFSSYLWNTGQSTACITIKLAGNYYVTVTESGGCSATSSPITVSVLSPPAVIINITGDTLRAFNALTYQWYYNNAPLLVL